MAATLSRARSLSATAQWGREMGRHEPAMDAAAFEATVVRWLAQIRVAPEDASALDGRTLRGVHGADVPGVHLVAAYAQGVAVVIAQLRTEGKRQELTAAQQVLAAPPGERMVTSDALLTQREVRKQVTAGGGDYLLPAEGNQPASEADCATAFSRLLALTPDPTVPPTLPNWL